MLATEKINGGILSLKIVLILLRSKVWVIMREIKVQLILLARVRDFAKLPA